MAGSNFADYKDARGAVDVGCVLANRYDILQLIARGGTSAVYKAADRLTGETLAAKVMLPAPGSSGQEREAFRQEVMIARKLAHRNIVRIFDIALHEDTVFITMELVDGRDLTAALRGGGPLNASQFLPVFRQLWEAIEHVHANRVLHRDIKLNNLMLTNSGTLKLLDFGIAQDLGDPRTVISAGTPGYLAPELMGGGPPSPQSDIFAAGLVCFELLTARSVFFEGRSSTQDLAIPGIEDEFIQLLQRCIDPDPARRPESATAVLSQASEILDPPSRPLPIRRSRSGASARAVGSREFHYRSGRILRRA